MRWTEKEVERLRELYAKNVSVKDIAEELGRKPKSIKNKACELKITNSKCYTEEEKEYIKENYKSYNLQEIAEKLGRDKHNICRYAREIGLERTGKKKEKTKTFKDEFGVWHPNGWVREIEFIKDPSERAKRRFERHPELAKKCVESMAQWRKEHGHPRGMLGKHHSEEYCKEISQRVKLFWENITAEEIEEWATKQIATRRKNGTLNVNRNNPNAHSRSKSGKRPDLNDQFFRSAWEANVARYFNFLGIKWEYEPKVFYFDNIKRGTLSYTPDFYLPDKNLWVEVKGWMDDKSKVKLKRFAKYYPEEKLELIGAKEYREIKKNYSSLIENWED